MATAHVRYSVTLRDSVGVEASTYANVALTDTTTVADMIADYLIWEGDVEAASDCATIRGSVTILPAVGPAEGKPVAGSSVEKVAIVNFTTDDSPHRYGFEVPGLAASLLTGRTIKVDTGALRVLIDLMKAAPFTNPYTQTITAFSDAFLAFRKRRKEVERATIETILP